MKPKPLESPIPGETFSSPERRKIFFSAVFFTNPPPQCFSHQPSAELHYIRGSQKCAVGPFFSLKQGGLPVPAGITFSPVPKHGTAQIRSIAALCIVIEDERLMNKEGIKLKRTTLQGKDGKEKKKSKLRGR